MRNLSEEKKSTFHATPFRMSSATQFYFISKPGTKAMGNAFLIQHCVSLIPCRDTQNGMGNKEPLPSGNCHLFSVVPACVHDITQLGRYLEFLGFISDQSCAQSLASKDEKRYIVW